MKLFSIALLAASLGMAQQAPDPQPATSGPTPITDPKERMELFDLRGTFADLQGKQQEVQAKLQDSPIAKQIQKLQKELDESPLGKELAEIQKQMNDTVDKYNKAITADQKSHKAEGCSPTGNLDWKCPPPPAK
jgi:Skp family chaperone for outer membrane proteins